MSTLSRILSMLNAKEGAIIATPLVLGLAGLLTFAASPAPATQPHTPVQLAQAAPAAPAAPSVPAAASTFSDAQRAEIEGMIKNYLLKHPEVMMEVSKELEKRQASMQAEANKKVIVERKASIFRAPTDFVFGNPKGEITVVEFFDYNCGWCKKAVDEVNKLVKADPQVRIVFKELPIFGEASTLAAKAAMASLKQGKYWDFHVALMKEKQVSKDNLFKIAEKVGLNVDKLKADMADPAYDAALKENAAIAQDLGIEGTPGFIVDDKVNVGFVPAEGITAMLADVRKNGCQAC
jgi:protein-disulfide isomerase